MDDVIAEKVQDIKDALAEMTPEERREVLEEFSDYCGACFGLECDCIQQDWDE